jgi:hypothetical protein
MGKEEEGEEVILSSDNLFFLSFVQLFLCKIFERNTLPISTETTMGERDLREIPERKKIIVDPF